VSLSRGASVSMFSALLQIAVTIVTLPLYLRFIGLERYGVLVIVWLLFDYFQLFNLGLDKAATNFLSKYQAEGKTIMWSAILIGLGGGVVGGVIIAVWFTRILTSLMGIAPASLVEAGSSLYVVGAFLPLWTVSTVVAGLLLAEERFVAINIAQLSMSVVFQLLPLVIAFSIGPSLYNLLIAGVAARATFPVLIFSFAFIGTNSSPNLKWHQPSYLWTTRLAHYGFWTSVSGILSPLIINLDRFFISRVLGATAVALYNVPYNLAMRIQILPGSLASVLLPRMSQHDARARESLSEEGVLTLAIMIAPGLVAAAFLMQPFLNLWLGRGLPIELAHVGQLLILGIWFNALAVVPYVSLQGEGRPDVIAKIHLFEIAPFVLVLWLGIVHFGVIGASVAWSVRATLDSLMLFYTAGSIRLFGTKLLMPLIAILFSVCVSYGLPEGLWLNIGLTSVTIASLIPWCFRIAPAPVRRLAHKTFEIAKNRIRGVKLS
jgi:O-antigen/teichoic acid export membrane protein